MSRSVQASAKPGAKTGWALVVAALAGAIAAPASAETLKGVAFAGGTVSESLSGHAGAVVALPGHRLGDGPALRGSVAAGRYEYTSAGTQITGKYKGADIGLVSQHSGAWGWANLSAGAHFSDTSLTPDDPGNALRGSRWDLALQTDGALESKSWRLGWYGSYGVFDETYQAKLALGRRVGANDLRLGVEGGIQGDPSYTRGFAGVFASRHIARNTTLQISAGASEQAGRSARAYGSIALSTLF